MKRILCLISGMNSGGAETFLMKLYRNFDRSKYQMDFCVNIAEVGFYDREILEMGGKIYHIPPKSENIHEFKKQLTDIVKLNGYEYVLRITSNTMGFMDLKIAKKAGAKVCAARSSNSSDAGGCKAKIAHRIGRLLYSKYVDVKIAPSDLAARYTFGDKAYETGEVKILKNAVDLGQFKFNELNRKTLRQELGILPEEVVCGHIGRFTKQKNHSFLIEIFVEVCKKYANARLLLVGTGELENSIKIRCEQLGIGDKVLFAGVRADIPAVLSAMDVFLFPSLYEGMPNTVIEAQANGLPCVISDSITKEANVAGNVIFESLDSSALQWCDNAVSKIGERYDNTEALMQEGYDIKSSVDNFLKYMHLT